MDAKKDVSWEDSREAKKKKLGFVVVLDKVSPSSTFLETLTPVLGFRVF
jgi:hypothetical protein